MPGAVPRAVGLLIAGISLVDATFLASIGAIQPALIAIAGFAATLLLQRHIAGT
jgi:4-hydroxybenzoate polyprenyltransferase